MRRHLIELGRFFEKVEVEAELVKGGIEQIAVAGPGRIHGAGDDLGDLFERIAKGFAQAVGARQPDIVGTAAVREKSEKSAVRRPARVLIAKAALGDVGDAAVAQVHDKEVVISVLAGSAAIGAEGYALAVRRKGGIAFIKGVVGQFQQLFGVAVEQIKIAAAAEGQTGKDNAPVVRRPRRRKQRHQVVKAVLFDHFVLFDIKHIEHVLFAALGHERQFAAAVDVDAAAEQVEGFKFR